MQDLKEINQQLNKLNEAAQDEMYAIEKKYNKLKEPILTKRDQLIKKIPRFWFQCFTRLDEIRAYLDEMDLEIFKHLQSLQVVDNEDVKSGYKLIMTFDGNEFFVNPTLTKQFHIEVTNEQMNVSSTSTPIQWKDSNIPEEKSNAFFVNFFLTILKKKKIKIINNTLNPLPK